MSSAANPDDDCPLPVAAQNWNIFCFATFWAIYYLVAPVSYIGTTHANILSQLGNSDEISNLPSAVYLWLTFIPVVVSWIFPHPHDVKRLSMISVVIMTLVTAAVAVALWMKTTPQMKTIVVIAHGALFGAANGFLITALWDVLRRGVSTSRRGKALGYTFGIGPVFACVGSLYQDVLNDGLLTGGRAFHLQFPMNYIALFAPAAPLILLAGMIISRFVEPDVPAGDVPDRDQWKEIVEGLRQFFRSRVVLFTIVIYVIVYSGGNAILTNMSLYAKNVMGDATYTVGMQQLLRFGFKAVAGALLGLLLAKVNPRATLLATTSILLAGMAWALVSGGWGWPFMLTFGILGAGELFGAHFPNYVTTASAKKYVRINMAYLGVLSALIGFSAYGFGKISTYYGNQYAEEQTPQLFARYRPTMGDEEAQKQAGIEGKKLGERHGRIVSIYVAAGVLVAGLAMIVALLPANPTPREDTANSG